MILNKFDGFFWQLFLFIKQFIGSKWKNQITVPKEYVFKHSNKEIPNQKKQTQFPDFYNKVLGKTNRSTSYTNLNVSVKIKKKIR